jgi:hypothetical protein
VEITVDEMISAREYADRGIISIAVITVTVSAG